MRAGDFLFESTLRNSGAYKESACGLSLPPIVFFPYAYYNVRQRTIPVVTPTKGSHPMKYNFDEVVCRDDTNAFKYDLRKAVFGRGDVIPLWVADMDFRTAQTSLMR